MVNATQMAGHFGKLPKDWLGNKSTKEFLAEMESIRGIPLIDLVYIKDTAQQMFFYEILNDSRTAQMNKLF